MNEERFDSDLIFQIWGKEKVIEVWNGLNLAYPKDYALLQGTGGKDHSRTSGIYLSIQDNARKLPNGKPAGAKALVPAQVFERAKSVAEFNLGELHLDNCAVGQAFGLTQESSGLPLYKDWRYEQTRVNTHKPFPDGRVAVTLCSINREQYQVINGNLTLKRSPWFFSVSEFRAFAKTGHNGTSQYDSRSKVEEVTLNMSISDEQMFELCSKVGHFERIWEQALCVDLVRDALRRKAERRSIEPPAEMPQVQTFKPMCEDCGAQVSEVVKDYSTRTIGKCVCRSCQQNYRRA